MCIFIGGIILHGELGVYVHIPFCKSKCYYCDFNSVACQAEENDYMEHLEKEIALYRGEIERRGIRTVFLGGGTPTAVSSKRIASVLKLLRDLNGDRDIEEVTIEGNPATFTREKLLDYASSGVNRVSLGVQSLNDKLLKEIGRTHSAEDVYSTVALIRECGIENINLDIMFGLPNQRYADVEETVLKAMELGVEHISYYSLKLEEGTRLYELEEKNMLELPDEDEERAMYHGISKLLEERGYAQYEISNYAKPGYECIHNLGYWKLRPYIGLGLSAASNTGGKRYSNTSGFEDYYRAIDSGERPVDRDSVDEIDGEMEMAEYMILGLRLNEGVLYSDFYERYGKSVDSVYGETMAEFKKRNMLELDGGRVKLTETGRDLSNQLFAELLP